MACEAVGCCRAAAMLAAISCPLDVASSCMWLPAPAASESGIEISCCNPLPTETGISRCWTGIAELALDVVAGVPLVLPAVASSTCGEGLGTPGAGVGLDNWATTDGLNKSTDNQQRHCSHASVARNLNYCKGPCLSLPPLPFPLSSFPSIFTPVIPSLRSMIPKIQLGSLGSAVTSPSGSGAKPQPKSNLMHFSFKRLDLVATI